jgi:hypothetical protein
MNTIFASLPIGTRFTCNGNECVKQSTRTALLVNVDRVFYFARTDRVRIMGTK